MERTKDTRSLEDVEELVNGNFRSLIDEFESPEGNEEEGEAKAEEEHAGKFSWIYLVNCSLKWTPQTPTVGTAFEKIELSSNDDRGFHADGEHANPLKHYFHGGSTGIQLLQVMELR